MGQERGINRHRLRVFYRAVKSKANKYTWSGLFIFVLGVVFIAAGVSLSRGVYYSTPGLLIGLGAIIAIIGLIRLAIGFINPQTPEDLPPSPEEELVTNAQHTIAVDELFEA
ncbi:MULTISPECIES: hypothetical protein [Ktedonobacter]|uniref:Uncharacterized protein n=1 Tax=Ktedonobacter robiniae TaxID=2778365 RepID=A0ABQ3UKI9_9CHLR|nr:MULTISPECIES: hypothetical protein [Ktedonobacter]GHO53234.1 hypothetical protein KSB_17090 [Ktedonobacter robiniae]GHO69283.1 hypothetical protein KSC_081750 [Ktedonobacter sp. SOSP1-52]